MTPYWPNISQLKCILACHWKFSLCICLSFVLYDDVFFYRHYKELPKNPTPLKNVYNLMIV